MRLFFRSIIGYPYLPVTDRIFGHAHFAAKAVYDILHNEPLITNWYFEAVIINMYEYAAYNNYNAFSSTVLVCRNRRVVISMKKNSYLYVRIIVRFSSFFSGVPTVFLINTRIRVFFFFFFCTERSENSVQSVQRTRADDEGDRGRRNVISSWCGFTIENRGLVSDRAADSRPGHRRPPQQPDPPGR